MNKQIEEMAEMLAIIANAREEYANDVTDHTENEYIREALLNADYRKQREGEWISVDERLPTKEEKERGLVGIVNGYNGKIRFEDAIIFVDYDFDEKKWFSWDYDMTNCKAQYWMPLPKPPKMKGGE